MSIKNIDPNSEQNIAIGFNVKILIGKILAYLPYFILSILVSLSIAFLFNRYSDTRFRIQTSILIKEKNGRGGGDGSENFLQGMQLFSGTRNIENELGILKSRSIVEETLSRLDFGISYFAHGSIRKTNLYGSLPFIIELDSNHLQCRDANICLRFLSNESIECWIEKKAEVFVPKTGELVQYVETDNNFVFNKNEVIQSNYFAFKIRIIDPKILQNPKAIYSFCLNPFDKLVKQYYNNYSLRTINKQASIIEISREGSTPLKEVAFLNQFCNSYIQLGLDEKNKVTFSTIKFIDQQIKSIIDTLGDVENQLQVFRTNNRIVDLSQSGSQLMTIVVDLEGQKAEQILKTKYYKYLIDYINNANPLDEIIGPSVMGVNDPILVNLIQKIIELYSKKKSLELSYEKSNPLLIEVDENLFNLKNVLLENINSVLKNSKEIENDINNRIALSEKEINKLPGNEQRLVSINRKYQLTDKLYTYMLEKRAEAGIAGAGINADCKVIDKAVVMEKTYPKESNNYAFAIIFGLFLPLAIILSLEFFNNKIKNHSQIQGISKIPLVGSIVNNTLSSPLVIANHPKSQASESFRNLRSNISYLGGEKDKKVIMITSTVSGEGKTFISMNLSSVLAIGGYKTLLIGVDLRKPKIFQDFKLDNSFGLTNFLIGKASKEAIIQNTEIQNLDIITSGPTPPNPSELIMSNAFYNLIEEFKKEYDYIILDTPPIGLVADGLDIMKHSDVILYVVRQNVSDKNYLNLINDLYNAEIKKSIGLIFNGIDFAAVYGYGYGAYGYGYSSSYGYGYGGYGGGYGSGQGYGESEHVKKSIWKKILGG
jgi:tyrosine-protein kinase Etk/Wzc